MGGTFFSGRMRCLGIKGWVELISTSCPRIPILGQKCCGNPKWEENVTDIRQGIRIPEGKNEEKLEIGRESGERFTDKLDHVLGCTGTTKGGEWDDLILSSPEDEEARYSFPCDL